MDSRSPTHELRRIRASSFGTPACPSPFDHLIERQERIVKVVEQTHKEDEIKLSRNFVDRVYRTFFKFDGQLQRLRCKPRLVEVSVFNINSQYAGRSSTLHLQRIKTAVA